MLMCNMTRIVVILYLYRIVNECFGDIFACNFENVDICSFRQLSSDQFNWTRESGSTKSASTGPNSAFSGSYYLYIETSTPRQPNDSAIIRTPYLPYRGPACLKFSYHMYGFAIGQLQIYGTRNRLSYIWTLSGNQNNTWHKAYAEFNLNQEYIEFKGTRGDNYTGDIAIDDITIMNGNCKVDLPFICGFEESNQCSFKQQINDNFDWTRQSNSTYSSNTGPTYAYQCSYYIYIETSSTRIGEFANITTPQINASGPACLKFNFHMYGYNIEELRVGCTYSDCFWSKRGDQQNIWHEASISIDITAFDMIYFAGYGSHRYKGDIAIDNVRITTGFCDCPHGSWGNDCANVCGNCKDGRTCDVGSGACSKCDNYYDPPLCIECLDGFWGNTCDNICGHCRNGAPCNKVTGNCVACSGRYVSPKCTDCPKNTWGNKCTNECGHCKYDYPCDQENGECYECLNSYTAPLCTECNLRCSNGGTLVDCGCVCKNKWTGIDCSVCGLLKCLNGEELNRSICTCECKGQITQDGCSWLPSHATLISNSVQGTMTVGSTLTLACSTSDKGQPFAMVTWIKEGAKYDQNKEIIIIDSVTQNDSGRWGCFYSNVAGNGSADWKYITVELNTSKPTDMSITRDSDSKNGEVSTIIAIVLGTLLLVAVVILLALVGLRYHRRKHKASSGQNENTVRFDNAGYAAERAEGGAANSSTSTEYEDVTPGALSNDHNATAAEHLPYMDLDQSDMQRQQRRSPELTVYQNLKPTSK